MKYSFKIWQGMNLSAPYANEVNFGTEQELQAMCFGSAFCNQIRRTLASYGENLSMQYIEILLALKIENFQLKNFDIFLIFAQNIDCGYTLEPPRRGGSNEYPQSMFWSKIKKNRYTPVYPSFTI